jgi:hypothetical protein
MPHSFSLGAFWTWLTNFPRHLFRGGESQIAVGGKEAPSEEDTREG